MTTNEISAFVLENTKEDTLRKALESAKAAGLNLVILALKKHDVAVYSRFKEIHDRDVGIHTVCMTQKYFRGSSYGYISNILMKVNLKLGGINHTVTSMESLLKSREMMILRVSESHASCTLADSFFRQM